MRFNLALTSLNLHSFVFSIKNEKRKGRRGEARFTCRDLRAPAGQSATECWMLLE